jgi:hypothetical protein
MVRRILSICACAAVVAAAAGPAGAEGWHRADKAARSDARAPIKDCTRFNGRYGYYGNPWCTPREQARFDRWQARRHSLRYE